MGSAAGCDDQEPDTFEGSYLDYLMIDAVRDSACYDYHIFVELFDRPSSYGYVIFQDFPKLRAAISKLSSCIQRAESCSQYWQCLGYELGKPCTLASFTSRCEGDTLVRCSWYGKSSSLSNDTFAEVRTDCSATGDKCVKTQQGLACGRGPCSLEGEGKCEGDLAVVCGNGLYTTVDCSAQGKECYYGACVDKTVRWCERDEIGGCDGDLPYLCGMGRRSTYDCRDFSKESRCEAGETAWAQCRMSSTDPRCPKDRNGWCDGSIARFCAYGGVISADCSTFANARCMEAPRGVECRL